MVEFKPNYFDSFGFVEVINYWTPTYTDHVSYKKKPLQITHHLKESANFKG